MAKFIIEGKQFKEMIFNDALDYLIQIKSQNIGSIDSITYYMNMRELLFNYNKDYDSSTSIILDILDELNSLITSNNESEKYRKLLFN